VSIRARLTIAIAIVLLITVAVLGTVAIQTTRATLTNQVDDQVRTYAKKTHDKPVDGDDGGPPAGNLNDPEYAVADSPSDNDSYSRDDFARLVYDSNGNTIGEQQLYGWAGERLSPPDCPDIPSHELDSMIGEVVTLNSIDGSVQYRTLIDQIPGGYYQAIGVPLTDVNEAVSNLRRVVVMATVGAFLAAIGICWWVIRRGLQPVDHMVATAADIAGGNLGARIEHLSPGTELGRLGTALNEMMRAIQTADDARAAGERKLRRFVADAAHELRTPLTSLRGYAELYRQGALADKSALTNAMGRIESEGERMARLVDDLLLLARLDQDRDLERSLVDLGELAADAIQDFRVVAPDRPATIEVEPGSLVSGDRMRLRQIVDNLLANVRTHTPAGTAVHVSVTHDNAQTKLTVRDSGPGIPEDDRDRIFERFWRADKARTRSRGGTGLGLAIVASLVEAHNGSIQIESEPGKGAAFSVCLPRLSA
jgi:two-component system, OmpR family, sensor kinase